jgi:hypothetical protein
MARQSQKSNLSRKATNLKRAAKGTAYNLLGYVPGVEKAKKYYDTALSVKKTVRAADSYFSALSNDVNRKIRKYL